MTDKTENDLVAPKVRVWCEHCLADIYPVSEKNGDYLVSRCPGCQMIVDGGTTIV